MLVEYNKLEGWQDLTAISHRERRGEGAGGARERRERKKRDATAIAVQYRSGGKAPNIGESRTSGLENLGKEGD